jgi:hypothetical protein
MEVLHERRCARQWRQVVLVQMHARGFDADAILRWRIDALRPGAQVHRPAGAGRANLLVGHGANTQLGELKDLARFGDLVIKHLPLAGAATAIGWVGDGLVDLRALAQG